MTEVLIIIALFFGILILLSAVARRYRQRLAVIGNDFLGQPLNDDDRKLIEGMLISAYSWRASIWLFLVYLSGISRSNEQLERECATFDKDHLSIAKDPRIHEFMDCYSVSAFATNPLFGILFLIAKYGFIAKAYIYLGHKQWRHVSDCIGLKASP